MMIFSMNESSLTKDWTSKLTEY